MCQTCPGCPLLDPYEDQYQRKKDTPLWWYNKSSDLHASAGALWVALTEENELKYHEKLDLNSSFSMEVACWPVYQMLYGMSFELMLKAICVASKIEPPHTHDLLKLTKIAEVKISQNEKDVLEVLTGTVVWDGRYPVPKNKECLEKHLKKSSDLIHNTQLVEKSKTQRPNDALGWESLDDIWKLLSTIFLKKQNKNNT